ncbi:MAG TPA: IclR family transcriptional regulator C-terminal domain-containing protein [Terriglobales bacterium]|nr:IclR family transcriptional regulator C-terminal domain-containing protein [Terriglobales bacterium]
MDKLSTSLRPLKAPEPSDRREYVQSIGRGFAVIKSFAGRADALTITDVAQRTGLSRASARRFLLTFKELGYVSGEGARFRLTPRVLDLGFTFLSTMRLPDIAQATMEEVVATVHESCSITVLDGMDIVYVGRVPTKRIMAIALAVGARLPAYPTSMGRVLLASLDAASLDRYMSQVVLEPLTARTVTSKSQLSRILDEVREQGWAIIDQEVEVGVRSVAAPIRDHSGCTAAAINISSHASRVSMRELRGRYLPILLQAADRISNLLGAPPRKRG